VSVLQTPKISIFEFPAAVNAASRISSPHAGSDHKCNEITTGFESLMYYQHL
jgi:hypothetical protein